VSNPDRSAEDFDSFVPFATSSVVGEKCILVAELNRFHIQTQKGLMRPSARFTDATPRYRSASSRERLHRQYIAPRLIAHIEITKAGLRTNLPKLESGFLALSGNQITDDTTAAAKTNRNTTRRTDCFRLSGCRCSGENMRTHVAAVKKKKMGSFLSGPTISHHPKASVTQTFHAQNCHGFMDALPRTSRLNIL
jgi:hypothetical protein